PDLFGISSHEIIDEPPSLQLLSGNMGRQLTEEILIADNNKRRAEILGNYLINRVRLIKSPDDLAHQCVRKILYSDEPVIISKLADEHFISSRQLERKFKTITGFAPKTYARLSRFHRALNSYGTPYKSLTDIALDCGYYDQSHFIHDFREFSGYEPSLYFAGKGEGIEYRNA
ncbi:MAG: AraC family transcriptional regulator, partial [Chitinophagaceae bacterium]